MIIIKNKISFIFYNLFINLINFYQKIISPVIPARCRYYPTCSQYGRQALEWHGVWSGSWLLLKRVGRCHPLGGHGIDFVPLPLASYTYIYLPLETYLPLGAGDIENPLLTRSMFKYNSVHRDYSSYVARLNHLMRSQ